MNKRAARRLFFIYTNYLSVIRCEYMREMNKKKTLVLTEQQAKMLAKFESHMSEKGLLNEENSTIKKKVKKIIAQCVPDWLKPYLETPLPALDGHGMMSQEFFIKAHLNGNGENREQLMYTQVKDSPTENRVIDYLKRNLYSQLSVRRGRGPEKYLPGAARILCGELGYYSFSSDPSSFNGGAIIRFCKTLMLINAFPDFFLDGEQLDSDLNGMSYPEFDRVFKPKMRAWRELEETESRGMEVKHDHGYTIIRVKDEIEPNGMATLSPESKRLFNIINQHANDWCICDPHIGSTEYSQYVGGGGAMYILIKNGFEQVRKPADIDPKKEPIDNRPLDEYGLSLICIIVGPDGLPDNVTTRWNHQYGGENPDGFFTARDIQRVTGINYFSTFLPRSRDELQKMHMLELDESKKKTSAQSQVHNRVNAGVMDAVTACGTMEEGAEPESDEYTIGGEGGNNEYFHINESKEKDTSFTKYFKPLAEFMKSEGLNVSPFPKVKLNWDEQDGLFIKTGYYEPESKSITIFCSDRHPKDILRTFAHEMIHHSQNLNGVDLNFSSNDDVKDNEKLEKVEAEAYLKGNVYFSHFFLKLPRNGNRFQENEVRSKQSFASTLPLKDIVNFFV